jgi:Tfp pilus assembly protein PilF
MNRKLTHKSESSQKKSANFQMPGIWQSSITLLVTLLVCAPSLQNGFVNWDDNIYIYENSSLLQGNPVAYLWSPIQGNYHPVTQATLWLDYQLFALNAQGYHFTSWCWHGLAAVLAWLLTWRLSGNTLLSMFVGIGFGIHPLHVESFAWVSGRKDLVYSVFSLATLIAWHRWLQKRNSLLLGGVLMFFFLALFSKPMAVVLPVLMWFIAGWASASSGFRITNIVSDGRWILPSVLLIPAFGLAFATFQAQGNYGAIRQVEGLNVWDNIQIAAHGLVFYFTKGLIPLNLSALHPYPAIGNGLPLKFLLSLVGVVFVTGLLFYFRKPAQALIPGLLWFGICLLPVLQLIPVGSAVVADRYFYLAAWGFLLALGIFVQNLGKAPWLSMTIFGTLLVFWAFGTVRRIPVWKDGSTLFANVLKEYPGNPTAANNMGNWLEKQGDYTQACQYYEMAVQSKPDFPQALFNLALCRQKSGQAEEAKVLNLLSIQGKSDFPDVWNNLGTIYGALGRLDSAKFALEQAISLDPHYAAAWNNLGMFYLSSGQEDSARLCFQRSVQLDAGASSDARKNLQLLLDGAGNK